MQAAEILAELKGFATRVLLAGQGARLDETTPLLEWGVLDSLTMVQLLEFIREELGIDVPDTLVRPEHFQTLQRLTDLLVRLQAESPPVAGPPTTDGLIRALASHGIERRELPLADGSVQHHLRVEGQKPLWVLLPGLAMHSLAWGEVLRSLAHEQEAVALDLAGFGLSRSPRAVLSLQDHIELTAEAMRRLTPEPVVLIGSSTGGWIAAELARRFPGRVHALVLVGWGLVDSPRQWWRELMSSSNDLDRFLARAYFQAPNLTPAQRAMMADLTARAAYRHFVDDQLLAALPHLLNGITTPTLLVTGEEDRIVPPAAVERAATVLPHARLERLARCGHFPPLERPQELLVVLRAFMSSLRRR